MVNNCTCKPALRANLWTEQHQDLERWWGFNLYERATNGRGSLIGGMTKTYVWYRNHCDGNEPEQAGCPVVPKLIIHWRREQRKGSSHKVS